MHCIDIGIGEESNGIASAIISLRNKFGTPSQKNENITFVLQILTQ